MRISAYRALFSAAALLASLGCSKIDPGFAVLDSNKVPQPLFNGKTSTSFQTRTGTDTKPVSGECDYNIQEILAQIIDVDSAPGTAEHVASGAVSTSCQGDGKFSFALKSLTDLGFTLTEGKTYEVQLRGMTKVGASRPSSIYVRYSQAAGDGARRMIITSGGTLSGAGQRVASTASFKGIFRVDHRIPDYADYGSAGAAVVQMSSGSSFKMKMGAAASAN